MFCNVTCLLSTARLSGNVYLSGVTEDVFCDLDGVGDIKLFDFEATEGELILSGTDLLNFTYWNNQYDKSRIIEKDKYKFCLKIKNISNNKPATYFAFTTYARNQFENWAEYDLIGFIEFEVSAE